jgi:hypothetical protein
MRTTARLSVVAATAGVLTLTTAPLALAQSAEYVGGTGDTKQTDTAVLSGTTTKAPAGTAATTTRTSPSVPARTPATLPFTGGEVVLVAAAGAAAVAAGASLVLGGRRRAGVTS